MRKYWRKNRKAEGDRKLNAAGRPWAIDYMLFVFVALIAFGCAQKKQAPAEQYTCPMHPTVISDKPGACPVCGMSLVLKAKPGNENKVGEEFNYLLKPVNASVISSIKTVVPELKSPTVESKENGIVTYDTKAIATISSRIGGRIEKLFVKYNFQPVRKGQKILEIYSPELLTAQRDLLYLLKEDKGSTQLIGEAKEKLRLLGTTDQQIDELTTTGKESASLAIYSQAEGYIVNANEGQTDKRDLDVREGMYVNVGQAIFKVVNTKTVWIEFDIYSKDVSRVNVNDPVVITMDELNEVIDARVNFVQPFYKAGESFTKVRVYLSNPNGKYRIGQLVSASFSKPMSESLWIPTSAQLDLGSTKLVFVKKAAVFQPRKITTGNKTDTFVEVLSGINTGDSIAYNAQYMIDSESFIKIKN